MCSELKLLEAQCAHGHKCTINGLALVLFPPSFTTHILAHCEISSIRGKYQGIMVSFLNFHVLLEFQIVALISY